MYMNEKLFNMGQLEFDIELYLRQIPEEFKHRKNFIAWGSKLCSDPVLNQEQKIIEKVFYIIKGINKVRECMKKPPKLQDVAINNLYNELLTINASKHKTLQEIYEVMSDLRHDHVYGYQISGSNSFDLPTEDGCKKDPIEWARYKLIRSGSVVSYKVGDIDLFLNVSFDAFVAEAIKNRQTLINRMEKVRNGYKEALQEVEDKFNSCSC